MSSTANLAYYTLWFAHPVLHAGVVGILLWRKLYRTFPIFFSYIAFQILVFAALFPLHKDRFYTIFYYMSWGTTAVSVILGFFVIHELFQDVFRPYHTLRDLGSVLFKWAALVMLLVAGVVAASTASATEEPLRTGIMTLQRSVRVVQCGLILFLLVFSRYLGTNWRQKSFGIAPWLRRFRQRRARVGGHQRSYRQCVQPGAHGLREHERVQPHPLDMDRLHARQESGA